MKCPKCDSEMVLKEASFGPDGMGHLQFRHWECPSCKIERIWEKPETVENPDEGP